MFRNLKKLTEIRDIDGRWEKILRVQSLATVVILLTGHRFNWQTIKMKAPIDDEIIQLGEWLQVQVATQNYRMVLWTRFSRRTGHFVNCSKQKHELSKLYISTTRIIKQVRVGNTDTHGTAMGLPAVATAFKWFK